MRQGRSQQIVIEKGGRSRLSSLEIVVVVLLALVLGQRLIHFGHEIDGPHTWRQADTAHYTLAFSRGEADLLRPAVSWMGQHRTLILEFPIVEAVVALSQRVLGERLVVQRAWYFAIFLASLYLLYRLLRQAFGREIALLACLLFSGSPLVVFFSRALIVDFAALGFGLAALCLFLLDADRGSSRRWLAGSLCLTMALLIKAPVVAAFLPLLVVVLVVRWRRRGRSWWPRAWLLLAPWVVFGGWQIYVHRVNGAAPEWDFLPDYRKFDDNWRWYFGPLGQRLELRHWATLFLRLREMGGVLQPLLAVVGLGTVLLGGLGRRFFPDGAEGRAHMLTGRAMGRAMGRVARRVVLLLLAGAMLYVLVFFNLNVVHNYYQIPMVVSLSLLAAIGLHWIARHFGRGRPVVFVVLLVVLLGEGIGYAERNFYQPLWEVIRAGQIVQENTPEDALLIAVWNEMDVRSPHLLYQSRRYGWSVPRSALQADVLRRLIAEGADHLVLLVPAQGASERSRRKLGQKRSFEGYSLSLLASETIAVRRGHQFSWGSKPRGPVHGWYDLSLFSIAPEP